MTFYAFPGGKPFLQTIMEKQWAANPI